MALVVKLVEGGAVAMVVAETAPGSTVSAVGAGKGPDAARAAACAALAAFKASYGAPAAAELEAA